MIAYFEKTKTGNKLAICAKLCNGLEYQQARRVDVADKHAAKAYCKANNLKPWNF